jgi:pyruvate/2-oxoglutarate dehydrogenase complex dihydrolipoamide acyltransferase (E2) component
MIARNLDSAEKWLRCGIEACQVPAFYEFLDVDMTAAQSLIETARRRNLRITYTHVFVRAAALALAANPDLHVMVCAHRTYRPEQVDIALSVAGDSIAAPLLVIEGADSKSLSEIAVEVSSRAPGIRVSDRKMTSLLRRWGWLLPTGLLRKTLLRFLFRRYAFRRKGAGTFQVSVLPQIDSAVSPVFSASAMLVAGSVRNRVTVHEGRPAVRPVVTLTCCADHRVWDGRTGQTFLAAVRGILESDRLFEDIIGVSGDECFVATALGG